MFVCRPGALVCKNCGGATRFMMCFMLCVLCYVCNYDIFMCTMNLQFLNAARLLCLCVVSFIRRVEKVCVCVVDLICAAKCACNGRISVSSYIC